MKKGKFYSSSSEEDFLVSFSVDVSFLVSFFLTESFLDISSLDFFI